MAPVIKSVRTLARSPGFISLKEREGFKDKHLYLFVLIIKVWRKR